MERPRLLADRHRRVLGQQLAAMEAPDLLLGDVRKFFMNLR
jgi:hypothetical protein